MIILIKHHLHFHNSLCNFILLILQGVILTSMDLMIFDRLFSQLQKYVTLEENGIPKLFRRIEQQFNEIVQQRYFVFD